MQTTMMDVPLTIRMIAEHARRNHGDREIVSVTGDGIERYTYRQFARRIAQLANALVRLGVRKGDCVASFAWNTHRHLELYHAVPAIGAVLHTVNIRLFPQQVEELLQHAGDRIVFVDGTLTASLEQAVADSPAPRRYVVMGSTAGTTLPEPLDYETLLAAESDEIEWPPIDERDAAILCYTSATTGSPKGVAYSHRSTMIHAYAALMADAMGIRERDTMMPVVPMFHVNAWGLPFTVPMAGAKLVLPGHAMTPEALIELIEREHVTMSAGVPTVWLGVREVLHAQHKRLPTLERIIVGGSAVPPSLMRDFQAMGAQIIHAWGMTECSPLGTLAHPRAATIAEGPEAVERARLSQGVFMPFMEWRLVDEDGREVPCDGKTAGELLIRGPWVTGSYYDNPRATELAFENGWFRTGDVCTMDHQGYLRIVDRSKDMIKSGGEWISSVELENTLMAHPAVKEAAVIGVPHEKWAERPVGIVVVRDGMTVGEDELRAFMLERVAKWTIPDRFMFVEALPRTGVGKFLKREMRDRFGHVLTGTTAP